ncbi:MAG: DUF1365 domain-containing protein [Pseudomonadota bacterium]
MSGASALYVGEVMHQRMTPVSYRFSYRVFSLLVDVDDAEAGFPGLRWLSCNRFNLLSFHARDHGPRTGEPLRPWIERVLLEAGVQVRPGRILINAYPRILGYQFNPLTVWYVQNLAEEVIAIVCEVSNTFGQHHHYLFHEQGQPLPWPYRNHADKAFHVSPLMGMGMRYHFVFSAPHKRLSLAIRETDREAEGEPTVFAATHIARRQPLSDAALIRQCLAIPFLTLKVIVLIHWQALKIWLRGARLQPDQPLPAKEISVCPPKISNP